MDNNVNFGGMGRQSATKVHVPFGFSLFTLSSLFFYETIVISCLEQYNDVGHF